MDDRLVQNASLLVIYPEGQVVLDNHTVRRLREQGLRSVVSLPPCQQNPDSTSRRG